MRERKGFVFENNKVWYNQYNAWKGVIKAMLKYNRPVTQDEISHFYQGKPFRLKEALEDLIHEGIVSIDGKEYPRTYKLNLEVLRKKITVVPEDKYDIKLFNIYVLKNLQLCYHEWINEAILNGASSVLDIKEYVMDMAIKKSMKQWKKRFKDTRHPERHSVRSHHSNIYFHDLWEKGLIGKVVRGEVDIEKYEKILRNPKKYSRGKKKEFRTTGEEPSDTQENN